MRFDLLIVPAALAMMASPAGGAPQNARPGQDMTVASAGQPEQQPHNNRQNTGRNATGAPKRISPLSGNDDEAWSHVGKPLNLSRKH